MAYQQSYGPPGSQQPYGMQGAQAPFPGGQPPYGPGPVYQQPPYGPQGVQAQPFYGAPGGVQAQPFYGAPGSQQPSGWQGAGPAQALQPNAGTPLTAQQQPMAYGSAVPVAAPVQQTMGLSPAVTQVMDSQPGVQIRLQRRMLEALTGFEQNNKYIIKELKDKDGEDAAEFFLAAEKSHWVERNLYPPDCGPWRMDVFSIGNGGVENAAKGESLLHLERPSTCTCCCLNRPEVFITNPASQEAIGSIADPFAFCDMTFDVKGPDGNTVLTSKASCFQCGFHCPCPGSKIEFPVIDPATKEEVAHITKVWMWGDCCPLLSPELDNFKIKFGQLADPNHKVLVMLLGIFIDFRYFNARNQKDGMDVNPMDAL